MGVDVWHDPSQRAHHRVLGAAADWECLCVCVCVSGKGREGDGVKKWATTTTTELFSQYPSTFSTSQILISLSQQSLSFCETPPVMDMTLDICCRVTQSFLVLSYLHLLFSLPPYHIPLLDLLALCWCPCAPSRPLFLHSCLSWRCIQVSKVIYRMLCRCLLGCLYFLLHLLLPFTVLFLVSPVFASSLLLFHFSSSTFPLRDTHRIRPISIHWVHCFAIGCW